MTLATYTETTPQTPFGGRLRRLDGVTGQTFPLTSDDEVVLDYVQFNASDRQKAE
jgi:hypothetical protein